MAPWRIEWLKDDGGGIPAFDFLLAIPKPAREHLLAILEAVSHTGPDQWRDSRSHCRMEGELDFVHEVRDRHDQTLYRLFVVWIRDKRLVVLVDGRSKANNTTIPDDEYARVATLARIAVSDSATFATANDFAQRALATDS